MSDEGLTSASEEPERFPGTTYIPTAGCYVYTGPYPRRDREAEKPIEHAPGGARIKDEVRGDLKELREIE